MTDIFFFFCFLAEVLEVLVECSTGDGDLDVRGEGGGGTNGESDE